MLKVAHPLRAVLAILQVLLVLLAEGLVDILEGRLGPGLAAIGHLEPEDEVALLVVTPGGHPVFEQSDLDRTNVRVSRNVRHGGDLALKEGDRPPLHPQAVQARTYSVNWESQ